MLKYVVRGRTVPTDSHGLIDSRKLADALFFPNQKHMKIAHSCITPRTEWIDNLEEFVTKVAKRVGIDKKTLWKDILIIDAKDTKTYRKRPLVQVEEEDSSSSSLDEDNEDSSSSSSSGEQNSSSSSKEDEEEDDNRSPLKKLYQPPIHNNQIQIAHRNIDEHITINQSNANTLNALANMVKHCEKDSSVANAIAYASMPFIQALSRVGPVLPKQEGQPERPGELQFGVSERIEQMAPDHKNALVASNIGKRALELYHVRYPGCNPPQKVTNVNGHMVMMNLYTRTSALNTLDVAIREALRNNRK